MLTGEAMRTALLIVGLLLTAGASAQKYVTHDGCDEGRLKEWESIIIGFEGDSVEQDDARSVRDYNKALCARIESGELTQKQANELYDAELEKWVQRVDRRQRAKRMPSAGGGVG